MMLRGTMLAVIAGLLGLNCSVVIAATAAASAETPFPGGSAGGYFRNSGKDRVIVFVNGIFGDAVSTWRNDDGAYWPEMISLDHAFDDVDIYVHNFQSPKLERAQQIIELAARLRDLLQTDGVLQHKQLVFLVHSMGGLITRAMLVDARLPAAQIPMIFFFATPSGGADVAGIAHHISENPQLKDLMPLESGGYVKHLLEQWLQTADDPRLNYPNAIASYCASEIQKTWGVLIVPENSADLLCNRETRAVNANHLGIVKPKDNRDDPYVFFKAAYQRSFSKTAETIASTITRQSIYAQFSFDKWVPIATDEGHGLKLMLQQSEALPKHIHVGCDETRQGEVRTKITLEPSQRVVYLRPTIANSVNVKSSWAAVVGNSDGEAVIHYSLKGPDREPFDCPAGGYADVILNYVIQQQPNKVPKLDK